MGRYKCVHLLCHRNKNTIREETPPSFTPRRLARKFLHKSIAVSSKDRIRSWTKLTWEANQFNSIQQKRLKTSRNHTNLSRSTTNCFWKHRKKKTKINLMICSDSIAEAAKGFLQKATIREDWWAFIEKKTLSHGDEEEETVSKVEKSHYIGRVSSAIRCLF